MIRIGIVGTGWMAAERASSFGGLGDVSVAGICSRNIEKARAVGGPFGAKAYDNYSAMLADCDAVAVCAPNDIHAKLAGEALAHGKHVLVEYPLSTNLAEAESLVAASESAGRVLMVGNTIIHEAMFRYLTENKARLGRILSASSRVAFYSGDMAGSWYMDKRRTGPLFAFLQYHHIEYYKHLLGNVEWVLARDQGIPDEARPDCVSVAGGVLTLGHQNGGVSNVQWYLSSSGDGLPRGLWITGSESSVTVVSRDEGKSLVIWDGGGEGKTELLDDDWGVSGSCGDFIDAIEGRLDHRARLASDILTMSIGIRATEAAERDGVVSIGDVKIPGP